MIRSVSATLSYYHVAPDSFKTLACRRCRSPLDVHQPNPQQSDQFLGTCPTCNRWYLVAPSSGDPGLIVMELPDIAESCRPPLAEPGRPA